MLKTRISAVSYINSYPFVFGLQQHKIAKYIKLSLDNPAICAAKLINNEADIGLIPVISINDLDYYQVLTEYCIGAVNNVQTVVLASNDQLKNVNEILLDSQSRSSNILCKVLAKNYWKKEILFSENNNNPIPEVKNNQGTIIIGDRVFETKSVYKYRYDLSKEWYNFSGLPFVFAAWIANKPINNKIVTEFEEAIQYGIQNIEKAIENLASDDKKDILKDYYTKNISYIFDNDKRKGMELFLKLANEL